MRLLGGEARSFHIVPIGLESVDHPLVDRDEARTAIVWTIGRMHMASRSRSATASRAHECLPRCVCEQDLVEEVVKPLRIEDGFEAVAEEVTEDG